MGFGGSGGGSASIAGATDAALSNLVNQQVLSYDSTSQKWRNSSSASGAVSYANLPAGTTLTVAFSGGSWPARPTSRTDITVNWIDATGSAAVPSTAIAGDLVIRDVS